MKRTEADLEAFLAYLDESGLRPTVQSSCLAHGVVVRDVFLDVRSPSVHAARMHVWWMLWANYGKSVGELARMFRRDHGSVSQAIRKIEDRINGFSYPGQHLAQVVRQIALEAHAGVRKGGEAAAARRAGVDVDKRGAPGIRKS